MGGVGGKEGPHGPSPTCGRLFLTVTNDVSRSLGEAEDECEAFALLPPNLQSLSQNFSFFSLESDGKRGGATPRVMLSRRPWPRPLRTEAGLHSGSIVRTLPPLLSVRLLEPLFTFPLFQHEFWPVSLLFWASVTGSTAQSHRILSFF